MSPSMIPMRSCPASRDRVSRSSVVLPAPGEDIRFTTRTPAAANCARLAAAVLSFSSKIASRTSTRSPPVWYPE